MVELERAPDMIRNCTFERETRADTLVLAEPNRLVFMILFTPFLLPFWVPTSSLFADILTFFVDFRLNPWNIAREGQHRIDSVFQKMAALWPILRTGTPPSNLLLYSTL